MPENDEVFDALGLVVGGRRIVVRLGPVDLGLSLVKSNTSSGMNQLSTGNFLLDLDIVPNAADYFGGISTTVRQGDVEIPRFTGSVLTAKPVEGGVAIEAMSAVSLSESITPGMRYRGVAPQEMIYVMTRTIGMPDERLNIDGLDKLPRETFEVLIPIDGITVADSMRFGDVVLIPGDVVKQSIAAMEIAGQLKETFDANTYALFIVTTSLMYEAESRGIKAVDVFLGWLTVQLRCGLARLPDGTPVTFNRKESLAQVRRKDAVSVRGLVTLRHWIRVPRFSKQAQFVSLAETERFIDRDLPTLTLQEELAILALTRATREPDGLAQVQALWEAIEFYVSGTEVDRLFQKAEVKTIRHAMLGALTSLSERQRERIEDVVGQLNNAPLLVRLKKQLDSDKVPIDEGEIELLLKLRKLRNDVVHGRRSVLPEPEDIEYAISIVARMLLYRIAGHKPVSSTVS